MKNLLKMKKMKKIQKKDKLMILEFQKKKIKISLQKY